MRKKEQEKKKKIYEKVKDLAPGILLFSITSFRVI